MGHWIGGGVEKRSSNDQQRARVKVGRREKEEKKEKN